MDKDGTKSGYDVDLLKAITKNTNIPVIASGGVGTLDHLYDGIVKGGASAVLAASIFHYGEYKIKDAKEYLNSKNVSVKGYNMFKDLEKLIKTIRERKNSSPETSYTNKLLNDKDLSVSKVKEEIAELIEAVEKDTNKVHEAADVLYHLFVYLESHNIKIEDIMIELKKRQKQ